MKERLYQEQYLFLYISYMFYGMSNLEDSIKGGKKIGRACKECNWMYDKVIAVYRNSYEKEYSFDY